jgi:hypothetical protein
LKAGITRAIEIERDFFNKLGVLIDGDFKFGVLLLVFVRFLGGDTGNLNGFPHLFGATFLQKMTETSPQIYTSYNIT